MGKTVDEIKITRGRITKLETDRASHQERIGEHQRKAKEAADEVLKYGADAANGDGKAREKYDKAKGTESLHREQARILQGTDADLRQQLTDANATLERLLLNEQLEFLIGETGEPRAIAKRMSEALAGVATDCARLQEQTRSLSANAGVVLGDPARFIALRNSMRECVLHATRAQLQESFGKAGFVLFDSRRYEGEDFVSIMEKPLGDMSAALESAMHTGSTAPVKGRAMFRAITNVSGLFGMSIQAGEVLSLPIDDPHVLRLVQAGGLEQIVEDKGAS